MHRHTPVQQAKEAVMSNERGWEWQEKGKWAKQPTKKLKSNMVFERCDKAYCMVMA